MTDRFTEYTRLLAERDAALQGVALLAGLVLLGWLGARVLLQRAGQDRLIALGAITYYTLLLYFLGGST